MLLLSVEPVRDLQFSSMVDRAIAARALPPSVCTELRRIKKQTENYLKYLDSGSVFGRSPFVTVLPVEGWVRTTETCNYADLDEIRRLRNDLVHRATSPIITGKGEYEKEKLYDRSMWILRQFASNVQQDVGQAIGNAGA